MRGYGSFPLAALGVRLTIVGTSELTIDGRSHDRTPAGSASRRPIASTMSLVSRMRRSNCSG